MDWSVITDAMSMLQPMDLLFTTAGVLIGIIAAAIPGLSGSIGIALLLPFTYLLPPITSLACLGGLSVGGLYGGSISAILLNIPGCGAAVATSLDGYPMAQQGRAAEALYASAFASFAGSLFGVIALTFLVQPLASLSLKFGPVEFFWLAILGLATIASLTARNLTKGILAGIMGLFLSIVGLDPLTGTDRFSLGIPSLTAGVNLVPIIIALFAIPPLLQFLEIGEKEVHQYVSKKGLGFKVIRTMISEMKLTILKSSVIGTIVGIIPGAGGYVAALVAYSETKGSSSEPESFGQGNISGVVAAEAANSATGGGALVPMLTFGIPGSNITAVLLGALLLHGLEPGPDLLTKDSALVSAFIATLYFSCIIMLLFGMVGPKWFSQLLKVPGHYLVSTLLVVCVVGAYAINSDMMDIYTMFVLGVTGYVLQKMAIPLAPIVLGLILGDLAEKGLRNGLAIASTTDSTMGYFFLRPISMAIIGLTIFFIAIPIYKGWARNKSSINQEEKEGCRSNDLVPERASLTKKPIDFVLSVLLILLALSGFIAVNNYPREARIFPIFCLTGIIVFSLILIFQNLLRKGWGTVETGGWGNIPTIPIKKFILIMGCYALFIAIIHSLGFILGSIFFIWAATFISDQDRLDHASGMKLLKYLIFSCLSTISIYFLFIRLLKLSLPAFFRY